MRLKELLSIIDREKVFEIAFSNMQKDLLCEDKKADKENAKLRYFAVIDEIQFIYQIIICKKIKEE